MIRLDSREKAVFLARSVSDKKAEDIIILDMRNLLNIADYFVICSGQNKRQIKAIAEKVREDLQNKNERFLRQEGIYSSGWILIDYGDVIGHIFEPEKRRFYDLESLWGDAPSINFRE